MRTMRLLGVEDFSGLKDMLKSCGNLCHLKISTECTIDTPKLWYTLTHASPTQLCLHLTAHGLLDLANMEAAFSQLFKHLDVFFLGVEHGLNPGRIRSAIRDTVSEANRQRGSAFAFVEDFAHSNEETDLSRWFPGRNLYCSEDHIASFKPVGWT